MSRHRTEILGVPVDVVNWASALRAIERQLDSPGARRTVIAVNSEKVIRAQRDRALLATLRRAALLIPDGIGVVAAARLLGRGRMQRVPGSELMPRICELAAARGDSIYLFGASMEANQRAAAVLSRQYPGLRIAGQHHGYVADADMDRIVEDINASGARILFLALGSPRQEMWMERYLPLTSVSLCQGVGGTFDVLAGVVKRAPAAFIRLNLEWLYRLLAQPSRLTRQTALPKFALQVLSAYVLRSDGPTSPPRRGA